MELHQSHVLGIQVHGFCSRVSDKVEDRKLNNKGKTIIQLNIEKIIRRIMMQTSVVY
jgi:hypothetical protein